MKRNLKREIPILMYHQFVKKNKNTKIKTFVTEKQFELHLKILKVLGYETITFKELLKIGLENRFDKKYIIITVDDGYKNNYEIMYPLLKKYNMKAVIYLVSGFKYNVWDVEEFGEEKLYLLNENEIKEMKNSKLIEFGGHTLTHPNLQKLNYEEIEKEIVENKKNLEEKYGINLISFAYPYGKLTEEVKEVVKNSGYKFAVSTCTGLGKIENDLYEIRRTAIDKTSIIDFLRKINRKYSIYKGEKWEKKLNETK
ncbi:polysaccharide deacetylase family protein [Fusobacterium varium]|uniref:polysaccharide deacetylase family protein n=1 Tax=Fusobacterium TaxID=848 RepID=UPI00159FC5E1|nr:polysaccharide deacetylase family protein [uncultured Fusobacterium sp.]